MWDGRRNPDTPPHVLATRFIHDHAKKRKFWSRAFSTSAVKDYGETISKRASQLVNKLDTVRKQNGGKNIELQKWFSYFAYVATYCNGTIYLTLELAFYSFDFMGDMACGKSSSTHYTCTEV